MESKVEQAFSGLSRNNNHTTWAGTNHTTPGRNNNHTTWAGTNHTTPSRNNNHTTLGRHQPHHAGVGTNRTAGSAGVAPAE